MDISYRRVNVFRKDAHTYQSVGPSNYEADIESCQVLARKNDALGNSLDNYLPSLWKELLIEKQMSLTMIEQTKGIGIPPRSIGFCFNIFIRPEFYREVLRYIDPPYETLEPRIYTRLYDRHRESNRQRRSPILSRNEVAQANAQNGRDGLFAYYCVFQEDEILESTEGVHAFAQAITHTVRDIFDGYRMQGVIQEAFSLPAQYHLSTIGFKLKKYDKYYQSKKNTQATKNIEEKHQLFLAHADRTALDPGTETYNNVTLGRPKLGLNINQQELLEFMLEGASDDVLAQHYESSSGAIRQRISVIYKKISGLDPQLLTYSTEGGKRVALTAYMKDHCKEIRPYDAHYADT